MEYLCMSSICKKGRGEREMGGGGGGGGGREM